MNQHLSRRLLGRTTTRKSWLQVLDDALPRLHGVTTPAGWKQRATQVRADLLELFFQGHPQGLLEQTPRVQWLGVIEAGPGYRIRKLRYEGYPGLWVPALLYEPTMLRGRVPAVLNPNGHHAGGKAMDYKQARCINLAKRGMLALNTEFIGMGELRADVDHARIALLDVCGVAGIGVFYLLMKHALDVLLAHRHADAERVAMTGLSGGGWQTGLLSAVDERIKVVVPVAGFSAMWQRRNCPQDIGDLEQCPADMCTIADYDVLAAMFAPRPTLMIYNRADDCCFQTKRARLSIYRPARKIFELLGAGEQLELHDNVDPGTHNYERDNRCQLYRFLNKHFGLDTAADDLPFVDELRSEAELNVGLPADNATLHSLALDQLHTIRRSRSGRRSRAPAADRKRLQNLLRLPQYANVVATARGAAVLREGSSVQQQVLTVGPWMIAATTCTPAAGARGGTEIFISDGGRAAGGHPGLLDGRRVIAVDLFGTGEAATTFQEPMLLTCAGERPLGILTAQLLAVAAWACRRYRNASVHLRASGRSMPVVGQLATALHPQRFASLTTYGALDSLDRLIDLPVAYTTHPELFCPGLLAEFDLPDLQRLSAPMPLIDAARGPLR
ncbi:MAG: acetylxylan esterase [bacterium]|nr:acetylxylan esterase [bacterium]